LNEATSPIDGKLEFKPQSVDGVVGSDGIIVLVRNDRLSRKSLTEARIQVVHFAARPSSRSSGADAKRQN
jgi:hypothetical protein